MINNPFLTELGFELISMADGKAELAINLQSQHMNSWQVMHGGVVMTLLDASMARAARSMDADATSAATIEMKTSFFQPGGMVNSRMLGMGRVLHHSKTLYYCEGEIWNKDTLVAKAMGTFKIFRRSDVAKRMKPANAV